MEIRKWNDQIDNTTQNFIDAFGELSLEQLNWKPNAATWSIAQNIDHLIAINQTYFCVIDSIRKENYKPPFLAKFGFMVSFFGRMILKAVQPDRKRKVKTFPIWEPAKSKIPIGILGRFKEHQSELKIMIEHSKDLMAKGTVISSPANRNIIYKLETAYEIIVTHEQRHFQQSKEVFETMKKSVSATHEY